MASIVEAFTRPSAPFRARSAGLPPSSVVHFHVTPELLEVQAYARAQGVLLLTACFTPVAEPCRSKTRCPADAGGTACSAGSTRECGSSVGVCKPGKQTCATDGTWGKCAGAVEPGVEVCDGKDNNCD